jgi:hypothetical protein
MTELFFGQHAAWYTVPALIGTAFFALRSLLLLIGGGHHLGDFHGDVHSGDVHSGDSSDSTHSFEILSTQSIAAFIMGFGWAGLAGLKGTHWNLATVNTVAIACGIGMVWILAMCLRAMAAIESSGTIHTSSAVGREGEVYVTVPGDGQSRGQVRVTVEDRERIYDAVSQGEDLATGTRVRVLHANDETTLTVGRA